MLQNWPPLLIQYSLLLALYIAEATTARATDFSPKELVALVSAFANMARWYYDSQLL